MESVRCPLMESATLDMMVEFSLPPVESYRTMMWFLSPSDPRRTVLLVTLW